MGGYGACVEFTYHDLKQFQPTFYPLDASLQFIQRDLLSGVNLIPLYHFSFNQVHAAFQARHPLFEITHIICNLINTATDMAEMFQYEAVYLFCHGGDSCS